MGSWTPYINAGLGLANTGIGAYSAYAGKNAREEAEQQQRRLIDAQLQQSAAMNQQTAGLRSGFIDNVTRDMQGMVTPAQREIAEAQYGRAKEAAIQGGTRGGLLRDALVQLSSDRARTLTGLGDANRQRAIGQAGQAGFGAAGTNLATVANAADTYGGIANAASEREVMAGRAVGQMASMAALIELKKSNDDKKPGTSR